MLHINLNGNFWKEIERVTSDMVKRPAHIPQHSCLHQRQGLNLKNPPDPGQLETSA